MKGQMMNHKHIQKSYCAKPESDMILFKRWVKSLCTIDTAESIVMWSMILVVIALPILMVTCIVLFTKVLSAIFFMGLLMVCIAGIAGGK